MYMYNVHCTIYIVQCTCTCTVHVCLLDVHCTVHAVPRLHQSRWLYLQTVQLTPNSHHTLHWVAGPSADVLTCGHMHMYMYMYIVCTINIKHMYMYMNIHMHSAPQWKKEENREDRKKELHTIKQTKIHNNLNGLQKYSLILGEQPQQLRKIYTCTCTMYIVCSNLISLEKQTSVTTSTCMYCTCTCMYGGRGSEVERQRRKLRR